VLVAIEPRDELAAMMRERPGDSTTTFAQVLAEYLNLRPEWQREAACRGAGVAVFFPGQGEPVSEALGYCARCPVVEDCRAYVASDADARLFGIWAGTSAKQRRGPRTAAA
jgi:hypothetical protein